MQVFSSSITGPTTTPQPWDERGFINERERVVRALSMKGAKLPPFPVTRWPSPNTTLVAVAMWVVPITWWMGG